MVTPAHFSVDPRLATVLSANLLAQRVPIVIADDIAAGGFNPADRNCPTPCDRITS